MKCLCANGCNRFSSQFYIRNDHKRKQFSGIWSIFESIYIYLYSTYFKAVLETIKSFVQLFETFPIQTENAGEFR